MNPNRNYFLDVLLGVAIGDALGVPVEFISRDELAKNPVTGMRAYGSYQQPAGTWSDDSSLTFCLAETLAEGYDLERLAEKFTGWLYNSYWTPYNEVFDVGNATREAIGRLLDGVPPDLAGGFYESSNGNGSLMRILPLVFYIKGKPIAEQYEIIKQTSSLTHRHIRSVISCFYYLQFATQIINGIPKFDIYQNLKLEVTAFLNSLTVSADEVALFDRLLNEDVYTLPVEAIKSSGYVLHTLEATIWCLLKTNSYQDAVLLAVNLGSDTDTTAACVGGLAGLLYGQQTIPLEWINTLARLDDIRQLADDMRKKFSENP
jgi:ADP-ribosyl-[dinitrogen reductase] hydrolase